MTITDHPLKYTDTHEWVKLEDQIATVGISDHAQTLLGDVVYVELPEVGQSLQQGDEAGILESVKAASDLYVPISGEVVEINTELDEHPEHINQSPLDKGWLYRLKPLNPNEADQLLSSQEYQQRIEHDG